MSSSGAEKTSLKYSRPKTVLMDLPEEAAETLRQAGYNVKTGSFGVPYKSGKHDLYVPAAINHALPRHFGEQEVVVVDLAAPPAIEASDVPAEHLRDIHVLSDPNGLADVRPLVMSVHSALCERILEHGGIFVLLADARDVRHYTKGMPQGYDWADDVTRHSNWDLLPVLDEFSVEIDLGDEVLPPAGGYDEMGPLRRHLERSEFRCTFKPPSWLNDSWLTFATNKYEDPVAGVLVGSQPEHGFIFLLPRVPDVGQLLVELFDEWLPNLQPKLFPHHEGAAWTRRPEYEIPSVVELSDRITALEAELRAKKVELEEQIEEQRRAKGHLHDLLTQTGGDLVDAVAKTLETLGFEDVRDADAEKEATGKQGPLREDLQVFDQSPTLLIEVKGIGGRPREASALQGAKYVAPRMREWNRTDVQALAIVNHQRKLPALERDNDHPFQDDVVMNAEDHSFGLMTTWDLYRLARNFLRLGWRPEDVKPVLYQVGRIRPIPAHYERIGTVDGHIAKHSVVILAITGGGLQLGDTVAYEGPVDFLVETVDSLQIDGTSVEGVEPDTRVAMKTSVDKSVLRTGTTVYRTGNAR